MLKSVLLHLSGSYGSDHVIEFGAGIAFRNAARLRGLSVLDTRDLQTTGHLVAAAHAISESSRVSHAERRYAISHDQIVEVGESFQLEYDSVGIEGDPIRCLVREAQYHDLLVTRCSPYGQTAPGDLTTWQHLDLVRKSRQPVYVSRGTNSTPHRVLLLYDGSEACARAIRTFLIQRPLPNMHCRLLGVGSAADQNSKLLRAMRQYCEARHNDLEIGCLLGPSRRVLIPYAEKWEADCIVLGVPHRLGLWTKFMGQLSLDLLNRTELDLYLMG